MHPGVLLIPIWQVVYGGNAIWNKYVLSFFRKVASFRCFQSDGEFIPDPRRSDREILDIFNKHFHTNDAAITTE